MDTLEKKSYYNILYGFYQNLLTEKQKLIFEDYYYEDFSLSELAENHEISRNAVFDTLKKVEKALDNYEELLGLNRKNQELEKLLNSLSNYTDEQGKVIIQKIREME